MMRVAGALFSAVLLLISMSIQAITVAQSTSLPGQIAFVRDGDLWIWEARSERRITDGGGVSSPRYSRDGRYLAYNRNGALWVVGPGSSSWRVASTSAPANWSPTDNRLALAEQEDTFTVSMTDDGPQPPHSLAKGWTNPAWSPDGKFVALTRNTPGESFFTGTSEVGVISASGDKPRVIWKGPYDQKEWIGPATGLKWSADAQWLAFYRSALSASISADANQLNVLPISGGGVTSIALGPMNPAYLEWAPTGATLAFTDGPGRDAWSNKRIKVAAMPPSTDVQSFTPPGRADREPAWSPGGDQLYFIRSAAQAPDKMYQPANQQAIWRLALTTGHQQAVAGTEGALGVTVGRGGQLLWPKGDGKTASLWTAGQGGPVEVVRQIDFARYYYGQFYWDTVLDWWSGKR